MPTVFSLPKYGLLTGSVVQPCPIKGIIVVTLQYGPENYLHDVDVDLDLPYLSKRKAGDTFTFEIDKEDAYDVVLTIKTWSNKTGYDYQGYAEPDHHTTILIPLHIQIVKPHIDLEEEVVWFGSDEDEPVKISLYFTQTQTDHPFQGTGKLAVEGSHVKVYSDKECTTTFNLNQAISYTDLKESKKKELYLKGESAGKAPLTLTLTKKGNGTIKLEENPARGEVEVKQWASILAEVVSKDDEEQKVIANVKVEIDGTTAAESKRTDNSGQALFEQLVPGTYKVSITIEEPEEAFYILDPLPEPLEQDVQPGEPKVYRFEVPYVYVEFEITYEDTDEPVTEIGYILKWKKPGEDTWEDPDEGTDKEWTRNSGHIKEGKVYEKYVRKGSYQLSLDSISEAAWGDQTVKLDESVTLTASVSGFEMETEGVFEIFDAHNLEQVLHTIKANVNEDELKASWEPAKEHLEELKSGIVVFRAKVGEAQAFSPAVPVMAKQEFELKDDEDGDIDTELVLRFSGGHEAEVTSASGKVEVEVPWGQTLSRIDLPGQKGTRVKLEDDDVPTREFLIPAEA